MNTRKIYQRIAREYGVTAEEVREEIQAAIEMAYTDPRNDNAVTKSYQNRVPSKGKIPTPEEMIRYMSEQTQRKNRQ